MTPKPQLQYSHTFNGAIWKVLFSKDIDFIAIEVRNETDMKLEFYLLDLIEYGLNPIEIQGIEWWMSLDKLTNEDVIIKRYVADANPEVVEYIGWSINQKQESWHKTVDSYVSDIEDTSTTDPSFYSGNNDHFNLIKEFVLEVSGVEILDVGAEYLEREDILSVSYYIKSEKLANYLLISDLNKKVLFHQLLDDNLDGIGQNTFSLVDNKLIFAKQKNELNIYQIH